MKTKGAILTALILSLLALALGGVGPSSSSQTLSGGAQVWKAIEERTIVPKGARTIIPKAYRTVRLDRTALNSVLAQAPLEFTAAARASQAVLTVPMPDGSLSRFRVEESPVMELASPRKRPTSRPTGGRASTTPRPPPAST